MMKSCVVRAHHAGLFSNINKILTCMRIYGARNTFVDWSEGCLYGDCWNVLFEPREFPRDGIVDRLDIITEYPNQDLTYINAAKLYQGDQYWRLELNKLWRALDANFGIMADAIRFSALACGGPYISVLIRGNEHAGEQISGKAQTKDQYANAIDAELRLNEKVFIASQDWESIEWFRDRFPIVYHDATKRSATRDTQRHLAEPQTIEDARQMLLEAYVLALGQSLIHPVSNIATCVLAINPQIKSVYLP